MAERYQTIFKLPDALLLEGSPVLIEAGALLKDNETGSILAQLKLKNITFTPIISCKVNIRAFEPNGAETAGIDSFAYMDLDVPTSGVFGTQTPITMPDRQARRIEPCVTEVVFADGRVWNTEPSAWNAVALHRSLVTALSNTDMLKQYESDVNGDARFVPEVRDGLFFCTCGEINPGTAVSCSKCGRSYRSLREAMDADTLREHLTAKQQKEAAEQAAAAAAQEKKQKRIRKISLIAGGSAAVIAAAVLLSVYVIVPSVRYGKASKLLESGSYTEAEQAFSALGDYKDSADKAAEAKYQQAVQLFDSGNLDEAENLLQTMDGYAPASDKLTEIANERQYLKAVSLMESEELVAARDIFKEIPNYKDATAKLQEIKDKMGDIDYLIEQEKFDEAIEICKAFEDNESLLKVKIAQTVSLAKEGRFSAACDEYRLYRKDCDLSFKEIMEQNGMGEQIAAYEAVLMKFEGTYKCIAASRNYDKYKNRQLVCTVDKDKWMITMNYYKLEYGSMKSKNETVPFFFNLKQDWANMTSGVIVREFAELEVRTWKQVNYTVTYQKQQ